MTAVPKVTLPARLRRMATRRPWRTPRLPDLASSKDAERILNVDKMTLYRWQQPGSGTLGPDKTYMIPSKRTAASPIWVREDLERFAREIGRQRAPMQPRAKKNGRGKSS